jgi:hypothetical protein
VVGRLRPAQQLVELVEPAPQQRHGPPDVVAHVGEVAVAVVAELLQVAQPGLVGGLAGQGGLADPGLPGDQHQPAVAVGRPGDLGPEHPGRVVPPDDRLATVGAHATQCSGSGGFANRRRCPAQGLRQRYAASWSTAVGGASQAQHTQWLLGSSGQRSVAATGRAQNTHRVGSAWACRGWSMISRGSSWSLTYT